MGEHLRDGVKFVIKRGKSESRIMTLQCFTLEDVAALIGLPVACFGRHPTQSQTFDSLQAECKKIKQNHLNI